MVDHIRNASARRGINQTTNVPIAKSPASKHAKKAINTENTDVEMQGATGRWTDAEHKLFLEGLQKFPYRAWKNIATLIQTRTVVQIRTHAQKYFQRLQKEEAMNAVNCVSDTEGSNHLRCHHSPRNTIRKKPEGARGIRKYKLDSSCSNKGKKSIKKKIKLVCEAPTVDNSVLMPPPELAKEMTKENTPVAKCNTQETLVDSIPFLDSFPMNDDELVKSITPVDDLMFLPVYPSDDDITQFNSGWLNGASEDPERETLSSVFSSPNSPFSDVSSGESSSPDSICFTPLYSKLEGDYEAMNFCSSVDDSTFLDPDIFVNDFFS